MERRKTKLKINLIQHFGKFFPHNNSHSSKISGFTIYSLSGLENTGSPSSDRLLSSAQLMKRRRSFVPAPKSQVLLLLNLKGPSYCPPTRRQGTSAYSLSLRRGDIQLRLRIEQFKQPSPLNVAEGNSILDRGDPSVFAEVTL